jgi:hypothetical protein
MIVTLDVFSGRPNPSWRLSEKDKKHLLDRVVGKSLTPSESTEFDNLLGHRGFIVEASSDDESTENLRYSFRIGIPLASALSLQTGTPGPSVMESTETERFLLDTGKHVLDEQLYSLVEDTLRKRAQAQIEVELLEGEPAEPAEEEPLTVEQPSAKQVAELAIAPCVIANTPYNPGFWNRPAVQPKNNCYNYSMNWRSDTFAQPGRISGHMYTAINCADVGLGANWDGCHTYCSGSNKNVALVIWPGTDYHWYRRHSQGFWGHKPGGTAARNTDNRGRVIDGVRLTPANCDRGPYSIFCGYRFSPTGMRVR